MRAREAGRSGAAQRISMPPWSGSPARGPFAGLRPDRGTCAEVARALLYRYRGEDKLPQREVPYPPPLVFASSSAAAALATAAPFFARAGPRLFAEAFE